MWFLSENANFEQKNYTAAKTVKILKSGREKDITQRGRRRNKLVVDFSIIIIEKIIEWI